MFEDSLVESIGRIRTRSRQYAAAGTLLEIALLAVLVLIPYLYPLALPQKYLAVPLIAPPPPVTAPPANSSSAPAPQVESLEAQLTAPSHIPSHIARVADQPPGPIASIGIGAPAGAPSVPWMADGTPPPLPHVQLARPSGPLRISEGVALAQLLIPIRPHYPAIAQAARVEGTVTVAATISTQGFIENLHVVSGPPLLVHAAVDAIRQARYRPFLLNGQPVEVQTTIRVEFHLDGN